MCTKGEGVGGGCAPKVRVWCGEYFLLQQFNDVQCGHCMLLIS